MSFFFQNTVSQLSANEIKELLVHDHVHHRVLPFQLGLESVQLVMGIHVEGHLLQNSVHSVGATVQQLPARDDSVRGLRMQFRLPSQSLRHGVILPISVRHEGPRWNPSRPACRGSGRSRLHLGVRLVSEQGL